jgi:hypothetical protein
VRLRRIPLRGTSLLLSCGLRPRGRPGATDRLDPAACALLTAAMALPGIAPVAHAQSAPTDGVVALRYLDYRDWQPGVSRMTVRSPSLYVLKPLPDQTTIEGSLVYDSMSGASPLYHNTVSGASGLGITDYRTAGDVKVTRWFDRFAIGVGGAASSERDYLSRAGSLDVRLFSEDRNTTLAFGVGGASDRIDSTNAVAVGQERHTLDFLVGITQAVSPEAIVQSNITYSTGHGYYSDPYKPLDTRPDHRRVFAWLTRYNAHLPIADATLRLSYRYLHDSFGVDAHTVEAAWVQPLPDRFTVTPGLRYTTQSAADFYHDPPFPTGFQPGQLYSADTRLAAWGAFTPGIKVAYDFGGGWIADLRVEMYRQRASWRLGGNGSPGLEPFSARWIEAGVSKSF